MGVDVPQDYTIDLTLRGGTTIDGDLSMDSDLRIRELPTIDMRIRELPEIRLAVTQLPKVQMAIDPLELSLRLKEIPAIRMHLPASFRIGLSVLGAEIAAISLCGEAQLITEDYLPNPCENCDPRRGAVTTPHLDRIDLMDGSHG